MYMYMSKCAVLLLVDSCTCCNCCSTSISSPSVLACSPHGELYYWANVLRDTSVTCEGSIDIGEGNSFSVTSLPDGLGCVVATTAAALFVVVPPSTASAQVLCTTVGT